MIPTDVYIDLLKAALAFGLTGIVAAVAGYWYRARWWRNIIGIAIQLERFCLIAVWALVMSSVFLDLNRFNSEVVGWSQVVLLFLIGVAHWFLYGVFEHTHLLTVHDMNLPPRKHRLPRLRRLWFRFLKVPSDD
jgi:hypothetical protein